MYGSATNQARVHSAAKKDTVAVMWMAKEAHGPRGLVA